MTFQQRRAFTLVELLVVIGIIAVLVSMLLPALSKVRAQSQAVACQANLKQFGNAMAMYVAEYKHYPNMQWPAALNTYVKGTLLSDKSSSTPRSVPDSSGNDEPLKARPMGMLRCPSVPERGGEANTPITLTYTMNGAHFKGAFMNDPNNRTWIFKILIATDDLAAGDTPDYAPIRPNRIKGPAEFGLMTEMWNTKRPHQTAWTNTTWRLFVSNEMSALFTHGSGRNVSTNILFADYHVAPIKYQPSVAPTKFTTDSWSGYRKLNDSDDALFNYDMAANRTGSARRSKYLN